MSQHREQQNKKLIKETNPDQIVREKLIKEVSKHFDSLVGAGIIVRTRVKYDFCMDYSTVKRVCAGDLSLSYDTLHKVMFAIAYYLDSHRRQVEAEEEGMTKKQKLKAMPELEDRLVEIYGCAAQVALDVAKEGIDLRQAVRK